MKSIEWKGDCLSLLDQRKLPQKEVYHQYTKIEDVWQAIKQLQVRGAPAIAIAGVYGLLLGLNHLTKSDKSNFLKKLEEAASYLETSRPTAVNLFIALKRMRQFAHNTTCSSTKDLYQQLEKEARIIEEEEYQSCEKIGKSGLSLITQGCSVLTHCNAGALAVGKWGTALAPLYLAKQKNISFKVYADETRPLLQGARLTAWELLQAEIDCTVICDNMAASLMAEGKIDLIITGADRVALNGDTANKIGTLGLAVLAHHFKVPFYIACPRTTIDPQAKSGKDIPIEERGAEEVRSFGDFQAAPDNCPVYNPAFDVTPASLISGFITEEGIIRPHK